MPASLLAPVRSFSSACWKPRRIVDFEHHFPGRQRQHRAIHGERELAAERPRQVFAHAQAGLGLELGQVGREARCSKPPAMRERSSTSAAGFLTTAAAANGRIGGDEVERADRAPGRRASSPRRGAPAQSSAVARFSVWPRNVLALHDQVASVGDAGAVEVLRRAGLAAAERAIMVSQVGRQQPRRCRSCKTARSAHGRRLRKRARPLLRGREAVQLR